MRRPKLLSLATTLFLLLGFSPAGVSAQSGASHVEAWPSEIVHLFESLPIQEGGRVKPIYTYAGFTLLRLQGKRSIETPAGDKLTPVEWLLDTLFYPELARDYPTFLVQNDEVIGALGITVSGKKKRDRYSFNELRPGIQRLFQLANEYAKIEPKQRSTVQEQVYVLATNVDVYSRILAGLDFARGEVHFEHSEDLHGIFGDRHAVRFDEVVAHTGELREIYASLAADPNPDQGRISAVAGVLQTAARLSEGSEVLALIPPPHGSASTDPWLDPSEIFGRAFDHGSASADQVAILSGLRGLTDARDDRPAFQAELAMLHGRIVGATMALGQYEKIPLELTYYKSKVLDYSQVLFVLSFLAMAFMWLKPRSRVLYAATSLSVLAATVCVVVAITLRCVIRERPPVTTLYETVLFVTGAGAVVALFMEAVNRRRIAISAAAILGMIGLFIANGYEMLDKRDTMPSLVAVLDTNFWLATHVTAITVGYSAGMLAALLASVYLIAKLLGPSRGPSREFFRDLARMVYGVLCFAAIFATVGTILGGIWANDSWGRFWGWDPKENGALLIVLSQLAILHARMGGYLKEHGICMAVAFSGTVIGFSWWGVNLLGVGLHSYGFTSGIHAALWTYYLIQWGVVGLGGVAWVLERNRSVAKAQSRAKRQKEPKASGRLAGEGA